MSMRHILSTTALLLLLAAPLPTQAQETRYRVEVIVLTHLGHTETSREVAMLRDYGDALDFLAPADAPEAEGEEATRQEPENASPERPDDDSAAGAGEDPTETGLPAVVHVEQLGEVMQDAWRRLRLSGPFRPLLSLAWEQGSTPPFPQLRVHDATVVMTQDPWAAIRTRLQAGEPVDAWIEAGLVPPIPPRSPDSDALPGDDMAALDPEAALLESLPPPRHYYALDGTVSLKRSRFLHLHVDLQQREALYDTAPRQPVLLPRGMRTMPAATPGPDPEDPSAQGVPSAFRVFDMEQNRQVKTGQVEYFDGPVLSVLAYVTALEPETGDN